MEQHFVVSPEVKRKILVLSGMGGCGKTQMVAYFVQEYHSQ
jgi:MinD superfamily P-loop ATPase